MRKAHEDGADQHIALLQYRNTPLSGSQYSPAQILMSQRLRDKLPCAASALNPRVVQDGPNLAKRQQRQKHFYDRSAKQRQSIITTQGIRQSSQGKVTLQGHISSLPKMDRHIVEMSM